MSSHTILLVQKLQQKSSRIWLDFETVGDAMDGTSSSHFHEGIAIADARIRTSG